MALRKPSVPLEQAPAVRACPRCGHSNGTAGAKTVQIEFRPLLTEQVFAFPDARAEVSCLRCAGCGYWMCPLARFYTPHAWAAGVCPVASPDSGIS
jgi:hypothetical protein